MVARHRGSDGVDHRLRVGSACARGPFGDDDQPFAGVVLRAPGIWLAGTENAATNPARRPGDASTAVASMSCG